MNVEGRIGFTLIELLIVVAIIGLLVAILIPALSGAKAYSRDVACGVNLKDLVTAFHLYAGNNNDYLPDDAGEEMWDELLFDYVSGYAIFQCPSDLEGLKEEHNLSYTWRGSFEVDDPEAALSGRQLSEIHKPGLIMVFDEFPNWHKTGCMNAATTNSTVHLYPSEELEENLLLPIE